LGTLATSDDRGSPHFRHISCEFLHHLAVLSQHLTGIMGVSGETNDGFPHSMRRTQMATMIVAGLVVVVGAMFAMMAVAPVALEEITSRSVESKKSAPPVTFERQLPHIAPAHEAQAA
jgi:hypothetical protein